MGWLCSHWGTGHGMHPGGSIESAVIWGQEVWLLGYSVIIPYLTHIYSLAYVLYDHNEAT